MLNDHELIVSNHEIECSWEEYFSDEYKQPYWFSKCYKINTFYTFYNIYTRLNIILNPAFILLKNIFRVNKSTGVSTWTEPNEFKFYKINLELKNGFLNN